ncbi:MAG: SPOR domain-containing protein, partial [Saprospiraceae bacterium]|nr:SPOR domain-containing protein [Saprospiraceae bacterium]
DLGSNMMPPVPPSNPMIKFVVFSIIFVALAAGIYFMVTTPFMERKLVKVKEMFEAWNDDTNEEKKSINPVVDPVDTSAQVVDFPVNEEDDKPVIKSEPLKTESTEEPTYVKIAIGVFGNPDNAARVVDKIKKAGFIPFTEKVGALTKVGVKQEYKSVAEKLEILDKVRSEIEKTAVIIN